MKLSLLQMFTHAAIVVPSNALAQAATCADRLGYSRSGRTHPEGKTNSEASNSQPSY